MSLVENQQTGRAIIPICVSKQRLIGRVSRQLKMSTERKPHPPAQVCGNGVTSIDLTPTQLIAKIRIAAASRLLRETTKPVVEIAFACGFCDHSAFTRVFRRTTGVTPSVFRKQR